MEESREWLRTELLSDFPFCDVDDNGNARDDASEANAFAMIITSPMRRMIKGQTPLFFVLKPVTGTGATLLAETSLRLFDGLAGEILPLNYTANEEEMVKLLVAQAKATRTTLFFDDVEEFNNRVLLRAITSAQIGGRLLGKSDMIGCPNNFLWIATGNNPRINDEMARRI